MECISTVQYNILSDGREFDQIIPQRGLRQGDPLSLYLFIMVAEGLISLINEADNRGDIHGIAIAKGTPKVSHLLFADDGFLFFKAISSEAYHFKTILELYANASGQVINLEKSSVFS